MRRSAAAMPARSTLRAAALLGALAMASAIEIPNIEAKHSYPKRSPDDSALFEWGNSAIIHNADGVVAKFGPGATHPEFELGIEADLVWATRRSRGRRSSSCTAAAATSRPRPRRRRRR